MTQMLTNLINTLKKLPTVTNAEEYYSYIKIDTTCPIKYCNEYLVLYSQFDGENILLTDLNAILEDSDNCKISIDALQKCIEKNNLDFDGVSVYKVTNLQNLSSAVECFISLIKMLNL